MKVGEPAQGGDIREAGRQRHVLCARTFVTPEKNAPARVLLLLSTTAKRVIVRDTRRHATSAGNGAFCSRWDFSGRSPQRDEVHRYHHGGGPARGTICQVAGCVLFRVMR